MSNHPSSLTFGLALAVAIFPSASLALNFVGSQKNSATFETLEEARVSGPVAIATLEGNNGRKAVDSLLNDSEPVTISIVASRREARSERS